MEIPFHLIFRIFETQSKLMIELKVCSISECQNVTVETSIFRHDRYIRHISINANVNINTECHLYPTKQTKITPSLNKGKGYGKTMLYA